MDSIISSFYHFSNIREANQYFIHLSLQGIQATSQTAYIAFTIVSLQIIFLLVVANFEASKLSINIAFLLVTISILLSNKHLSKRMKSSSGASKLNYVRLYFVVLIAFQILLMAFYIISIGNLILDNSIIAGALISLYLCATIFGLPSIYKSFKLSIVMECVGFIILIVSSPADSKIYKFVPFLLLLAIFNVQASKQIEDSSISSYVSSQKFSLEAKKLNLCFENANNAVLILNYNLDTKSMVVDYHNSEWEKAPLYIKSDKEITQLLETQKIGQKTIMELIKETLLKQANAYSAIDTCKVSYNTCIYNVKEPEYFKVDVSICQGIDGLALIYIQFINETRLIKMAKMQSNEKMLNSFTHELYTPLNTILAILEKKNASEITNADLQVFNININILHFKLRDIITYAEYICGSLHLSRSFIDIRKCIQKATSLYIDDAKSKGINIKFIHSNLVPRTIFVDEIRIMQIITNILSNSIKYTLNNGSITISLTITPNDLVEIRIEDTGLGFDAKQIEDGKLIGMGMTIIKFISEHSNCNFQYVSQIGKGSKFWFYVKNRNSIFDIPDEYAQIDSLHLNSGYSSISLTHGNAIIVADDIFFNRLTLKSMLSSILPSSSIFECSNGLETVEMVQKMNYKQYSKVLIFMDIDMPVMDGIDATSAISQWAVDNKLMSVITVVGITAFNSIEYFQRGMSAGMKLVYTKPVTNQQLKGCIKMMDILTTKSF